jgi:hypothetical protein
MKKIYVGNLPFSATEDELRQLFTEHGTVESVNMITDRDTGRPRGFGFIEMAPADADTESRHSTAPISADEVSTSTRQGRDATTAARATGSPGRS